MQMGRLQWRKPICITAVGRCLVNTDLCRAISALD